MTTFLLTAVLSYLLGSIPFGYILVRLLHGEDVRETGSGNIGATNVSRTSPPLGMLTLVLDAAKGYFAVYFAFMFWEGNAVTLGPWQMQLVASVAAFFAIVGHMFPVWLKFRGGKGVATGLGAFIWIAPEATLGALAIFVLVVSVFRYVSLGSLLAVAFFPPLAWFLDLYPRMWQVLAIMALACVLIIMKHHQNIRRLITGTESRLLWKGQ